MKLELLEEVGETRIGVHRWRDPSGDIGGNQLYASTDGTQWRPIEVYVVERTITGDRRIILS